MISFSYFILSTLVITRVKGWEFSVKNSMSIESLGKRPTCKSISRRMRCKLPDYLR